MMNKILPPDEISWGKSLMNFPSFTIKEIEEHRLKSGKTPESSIIKTLNRGRQFKNERYISADSIYTKWDDNLFTVMAQCKASMKKDKRKVVVNINIMNSKVVNGNCTCPAGKSGYCNHVMALLLELADYSLTLKRLWGGADSAPPPSGFSEITFFLQTINA